MADMPKISGCKLFVTASLWGLLASPAIAQEQEPAPAAEEPADDAVTEAAESTAPAAMEEIIVVSPKPGSRRDLDAEYEDPVKAQLLKEFYRMQELDAENAWRESRDKDDSRIQWGYDPRDEYRMRNDTALQDLSWEKNKPAKVFSVEF